MGILHLYKTFMFFNLNGSGTGHGVGAALNVHEGPQSISFRFGNLTALQKGMVVSNEPGYYEDNSFGIRIEVVFLIFIFFLKCMIYVNPQVIPNMLHGISDNSQHFRIGILSSFAIDSKVLN